MISADERRENFGVCKLFPAVRAARFRFPEWGARRDSPSGTHKTTAGFSRIGTATLCRTTTPAAAHATTKSSDKRPLSPGRNAL